MIENLIYKRIKVLDVLIVLLVLYGIAVVARGQQAPAPQPPAMMRMTTEQQLIMQSIMQQQENLRLQICISQEPPVGAAECGQLTPTGVMRIPKATAQTPAATPPTAPAANVDADVKAKQAAAAAAKAKLSAEKK